MPLPNVSSAADAVFSDSAVPGSALASLQHLQPAIISLHIAEIAEIAATVLCVRRISGQMQCLPDPGIPHMWRVQIQDPNSSSSIEILPRLLSHEECSLQCANSPTPEELFIMRKTVKGSSSDATKVR